MLHSASWGSLGLARPPSQTCWQAKRLVSVFSCGSNRDMPHTVPSVHFELGGNSATLCLMGVTAAGKTTLVDVLAGRKTGERFLPYQF